MAKDKQKNSTARNAKSGGDTWTAEQDEQLLGIVEGEKQKSSRGLYEPVEAIMGRTKQAARLRMMKIRRELSNPMNKRAMALQDGSSTARPPQIPDTNDSPQSLHSGGHGMEIDITHALSIETESSKSGAGKHAEGWDDETELPTAKDHETGGIHETGPESTILRRAYSSSQNVELHVHGKTRYSGLQHSISFAEYAGGAAIKQGLISDSIVEKVENAYSLIALSRHAPGASPSSPTEAEKWTKILELAYATNHDAGLAGNTRPRQASDDHAETGSLRSSEPVRLS